MEQEIIHNEHNKQEYFLIAKRVVNMYLNVRMSVLIVGLFILCGCQNTSESSAIGEEKASIETTIDMINVEDTLTENKTVIDSVAEEALLTDKPMPPPISSLITYFGKDIENVYRKLDSAEIANLNFDDYQLRFFDKELLSFREYTDENMPYYSKAKCSSCNNNILVIYGSTPQEYWNSLSGRAGNYAICKNCKEILYFELTEMN